jgi:hypothetical protein
MSLAGVKKNCKKAVALQPLRNVNKKYLNVPQKSKNNPI